MVTLAHFNFIFTLIINVSFYFCCIFLNEKWVSKHFDNFFISIDTRIDSKCYRQFLNKNLFKMFELVFIHYILKYFTVIFIKFRRFCAIFSQFINFNFIMITLFKPLILFIFIFNFLFFFLPFVLPYFFMG